MFEYTGTFLFLTIVLNVTLADSGQAVGGTSSIAGPALRPALGLELVAHGFMETQVRPRVRLSSISVAKSS